MRLKTPVSEEIFLISETYDYETIQVDEVDSEARGSFCTVNTALWKVVVVSIIRCRITASSSSGSISSEFRGTPLNKATGRAPRPLFL